MLLTPGCTKLSMLSTNFWDSPRTCLRPIYVMFFKFLVISFQMKNNDDRWL